MRNTKLFISIGFISLVLLYGVKFSNYEFQLKDSNNNFSSVVKSLDQNYDFIANDEYLDTMLEEVNDLIKECPSLKSCSGEEIEILYYEVLNTYNFVKYTPLDRDDIGKIESKLERYLDELVSFM